MSEKRRDNRNRIFCEGEYQRADGRYRFRYIYEDGKEKCNKIDRIQMLGKPVISSI